MSQSMASLSLLPKRLSYLVLFLVFSVPQCFSGTDHPLLTWRLGERTLGLDGVGPGSSVNQALQGLGDGSPIVTVFYRKEALLIEKDVGWITLVLKV